MSQASWERHVCKWDEVCAEIERFDQERVAQVAANCILELSRRKLPLTKAQKKDSSKDKKTLIRWRSGEDRNAVTVALEAQLFAEMPAFYARRGWSVGNETFGGCLCCAFPTAIGSGTGGQWVVDEMKPMVQCINLWKPIIEQADKHLSEHFVSYEQFDAPVFENAVLAMIEVMTNYGWLSESWYHFADDGVRWLINALTGVDPADPRLADIESGKFSFSSWTAPALDAQAPFATAMGTLAETLLRQNKAITKC